MTDGRSYQRNIRGMPCSYCWGLWEIGRWLRESPYHSDGKRKISQLPQRRGPFGNSLEEREGNHYKYVLEQTSSHTETALWTNILIPNLVPWVNSSHINSDYYLTQILPEYSAVRAYTKRMREFCWTYDSKEKQQTRLKYFYLPWDKIKEMNERQSKCDQATDAQTTCESFSQYYSVCIKHFTSKRNVVSERSYNQYELM